MLVPLEDAVRDTCGGKAGALGELLRAGLPVPDGFVLPFDTYRASARGTRLPDGLLDALVAGLARLGPGPLAVRSSAADEDTAGASAAGQHETVLAVHGPDDVARAVRTCWASLHSPRAVDYRTGLDAPAHPVTPDPSQEQRGDAEPHEVSATGPPRGPVMAVLVQRLVDPDAAGVLFTPASPDGETVIEASWGLGQPIVGGTVTPDRYRLGVHPTLGRGAARVVDRVIADKSTRLDRDGDRLLTRDVPTDQRRRAALDDTTAVGLARLAWRAQDALDGPLDVEWALADGRPWILQARPVTAALPALTAPRAAPPAEPGAMSADGTAGPPPTSAEPAGPARLHGTPGSTGVASGTARIVRGPADFPRVRPGDVLVCPFTDPAWTPLLRVAAAVVTETGGVLSHAAIVARERRIPAILGVEGATTEIRDGSLLRVDGAAGTVEVVGRNALAPRRASPGSSDDQPAPPGAG